MTSQKVKVLYIDHVEADFLSALVYLGLTRHLGAENVVDWPFKKSFHGECDTYPSFYEPGQMGCTCPHSWMVAQPGRPWSLDEITSSIDNFDLVVLASPRKNNTAALGELVARVGRSILRKLAIMDGEDYVDVRQDLIDRFAPDAYLKRECVFKGVRPFPFASPADAIEPACAKDIDVVFLGGNTWPARTEAVFALRRAFGSRFISGHVGYDEYKECLARARIAVSVRGHGFDTLRYWEIPSFEGTMMVADRVPIARPNDYAIARFSSPEELVAIVRQYLDDEPLRAQVAAACNSMCLQFHTARARARQLLAEVNLL